MSEWSSYKFSDIAEFNPKETLSKNTFAKKVAMEKLVPFCRDIPDYEEDLFSGGTKFRNGDTIMARITPCLENGKTAKVNILDDGEVGFGSTEYIVLRAKPDIVDPDFLYYLASSSIVREPAIKSMVGSSGRQRVQTNVVKNLELQIPPIHEQQTISSCLKALDDKIFINNQINDNLQQQVQLLFKSWFIDFDPFNKVLPSDWKTGTFSDIIESLISGDWGKEKPTGNYEKQVFCIRGADIPDVQNGNKGKMPVRYILPKNFESKKLQSGDLVIEISGGSPTQSTGRATIISQSLLDRYEYDLICTNFCKAITPKKGYSSFLYYYWQYLYKKGVFFSYENGTTGIKNLDIIGILENEPINIPTKEIIDIFSEICITYLDKIYTNGLETEKLSSIRDQILPKLLSGEIDVSEIEI